METDLYNRLKRLFPVDTVDITEERLLIVSWAFTGLAPKERESSLLRDEPDLEGKRFVLLTPAEVKDLALGNPVANSMPPAEKSFVAGEVERMQDRFRTADLYGLTLDTASLFQNMLTCLRLHEAALVVSARDIKELREALAHRKDSET